VIASALMNLYPTPPELFGLIRNMPVVDNTVQRALFATQRASWEGPDGVGYTSLVHQVGNQQSYQPDQDWTYLGDVYSVQLTLGLGNALAPDILSLMMNQDPEGVGHWFD
jgi:hypothetical protein